MSTAGVSLMQALEHIDDPRSPSNGTRHDFRERLVVAICAMLSDNDTFEEMVAWARYSISIYKLN
jgi:hypothetical protein